MRVSELGEFGLIDALCRRVPTTADDLALAVGDDAAVWRPHGLTIATTDTMVDEIHFRLADITPAELGWKSLAVNLSDIASMGGVPRWALITLGLHPETPADLLTGLYDGLAEACRAFGVVVAGGDIVSTRGPLFVTVTLLGDTAAADEAVMRRAAARPGDQVAVTGTLGGSAAWLQRPWRPVSSSVEADLRRAHYRPLPRVAEGQALLAAGVRCAMDVSDGLVQDLGHLCRASGVSATVDVERVPVHPSARAALGDAAGLDRALYGGEDYELLLCAPAEVIERAALACREHGTPLTVIGRIEATAEQPVRLVGAAGPIPRADTAGWDHLRGGADHG